MFWELHNTTKEFITVVGINVHNAWFIIKPNVWKESLWIKKKRRNSMITYKIKTCKEAIFQNKLFDML